MKSNKISGLATGTVLLLAVGLLSGCANEPEDAEQQSKEVAVAPIQSEVEESIGMESFEGLEPMQPIESIEDILDGLAETTGEMIDVETGAVSATTDAKIDVMDSELGAAQDLIDETQATVSAAIDEDTAVALAEDAMDVVVMTPEITLSVQQALVDAGFKPGPVDGFSGSRTLAAIENFQAQNNLAVGQVTKETLRALGVDFE